MAPGIFQASALKNVSGRGGGSSSTAQMRANQASCHFSIKSQWIPPRRARAGALLAQTVLLSFKTLHGGRLYWVDPSTSSGGGHYGIPKTCKEISYFSDIVQMEKNGVIMLSQQSEKCRTSNDNKKANVRPGTPAEVSTYRYPRSS